jgi:bifunctional non-homologous end joining protein LigD
MPLETYRAKRDFTKSPEPAGQRAARKTRGPLFFCVQKHLASHLHYDFRLEHEGVLLSWAVPKGPALDPSIKRFATQVEDHPLDYGEFEGVIPEGYGAGIVMLWDKGTWEPETEDVAAALKKGDLKFRLNGFKLKGSWVLVRTRGGPGDRSNWLLIKHRDEWAGAIEVTEAFPDSVKSAGDLADILSQNNPEIWMSNRPARGGQAGDLFEKIVSRALALRASPARQAPAKPDAPPAATKPTAAKRTVAKRTVAKRTVAKRTVAKGTVAKRTASKTAVARKPKRRAKG